MSILINEFVNMVVNILVFSSIPFIWYVISNKKVKGFLSSIGLHKYTPMDKKTPIIFIVTYILGLIFLLLSIYLFQVKQEVSELKMLSKPVFVLIYMVLYGFKTGVAEEIFFRGFVGKKLISSLGFKKGNILQSIIFAFVHIISITEINWIGTFIRIINAFVCGLVFGFVMEKKANKSIVPCIIAHMIYNILSCLVLFVA